MANERTEGVAALGAMVVDERFGALQAGSQGDAMDDSGGQGFGGVFAGGASVKERIADGGRRNHDPRLDADAGEGGASVLVEGVGGLGLSTNARDKQKRRRKARENRRAGAGGAVNNSRDVAGGI